MSPVALRQQIGQLLVAGFDGPELPVELQALAREFSIGGVILFKRNVEDPDQVREVARQIEALARELPPWVAVDQEGGRVARLKRPFTEWPPMIALGRIERAPSSTRRFARALGRGADGGRHHARLRAGARRATNPTNPAIGDRALATMSSSSSELGRVIITELQAAGIAACGKHFPGPRRHGSRLAPRAAARRAPAGPAARRRVRPVRSRDRRRRRARSSRRTCSCRARRGAARHAVAPHRHRHPARRAAASTASSSPTTWR